MAKKATRKKVTRKRNVPRNEDQAASMVARIGELSREIASCEAELNDRVTEHQDFIECAKLETAETIKRLEEKIVSLYKGVREWGDENRNDLVTAANKTFRLASGTCSWRLTPSSVKTTKGNTLADAVKELHRRQAGQYLRVKTEVDKEAILAEPDVFKKRNFQTIHIVQMEEFVIQPCQTPIELGAVKGAKVKITRKANEE